MGLGNTPSPLLPFLGGKQQWRVKREKVKKSPITKEDNRIIGAVANTLCLRHSEQDAYSNRRAVFYFFFLFRDNLKCRNPKCIPLHILNARYQTLKGHCQDKDHTQHLKHLMGKKNPSPPICLKSSRC